MAKMICDVCGAIVDKEQIEQSSGGDDICLDCWNHEINFEGVEE